MEENCLRKVLFIQTMLIEFATKTVYKEYKDDDDDSSQLCARNHHHLFSHLKSYSNPIRKGLLFSGRASCYIFTIHQA